MTIRYEYMGGQLTIKQLAMFSPVGSATIRKRIADGWSVTKSVERDAKHEYKKSRKCTAIKHEYHGELRTIVELSELSLVTGETIRSRIACGWAVIEAVDTAGGVTLYPTSSSVRISHNSAMRKTEALEKKNRSFARCAARINH